MTQKLLNELCAVTAATVRAAGPRYTPGMTSGAPNLEVAAVSETIDALCLNSDFRQRLSTIASTLRSTARHRSWTAQFFHRRTVTHLTLAADLEEAAASDAVESTIRVLKRLQRRSHLITAHLESLEQTTRAELQALPTSETSPTDPAQNAPAERLRSQLSTLREVRIALEPLSEFLHSNAFTAATSCPPVLLLGDWGTGKTHFVCDFALQALEEHIPCVAVLANSLIPTGDPVASIALKTHLGTDSAQFLEQLSDSAVKLGRRAIILIDAVNEADRRLWRDQLEKLFAQIGAQSNVALVVSCRTPFQHELLTETAREIALSVLHPGFQEQEFDAQLDFFRFYNLPPLQVPLLAAEFSRPLFLKLMCAGLADLSKRTKRRHLTDIASGQKGMTYILEYFVRQVSEPIERSYGLERKSIWRILKGESNRGLLGVAGRLALNLANSLSSGEIDAAIAEATRLTRSTRADLIRDLLTNGLIVEQVRYTREGYLSEYALPYQRFSDHLVARHLLDAALDTSSVNSVRRSFYAGQRLGRVFALGRSNSAFAEPGIASALMVEFPERVKRLSSGAPLTGELVDFIPRERRSFSAVADAFIDGLNWRSSASFSTGTKRLLDILLTQGTAQTTESVYEVLVGLAARSEHPWNAAWLWQLLSQRAAPTLDATWSEFLRLKERESNVNRLLAWTQRIDPSSVDVEVAENTMRLLLTFMTTTDRGTRDEATRHLVRFGENNLDVLFDLALQSTDFPDPYVRERALAACYGAAVRQAQLFENNHEAFELLRVFVGNLWDSLLSASSSNPTWHALTRGYALGMLQLCAHVDPASIPQKLLEDSLRRPDINESPFRSTELIEPADTADGESAISMDFGNYTIGRLIDGRGNYDMEHPEYKDVRAQIADRMHMLGYREDLFGQIDKRIAEYSYSRQDAAKVDRYGKKYSWIAFFEMYGWRAALGLLEDFPKKEPRPSDADIDPSFPTPIRHWTPGFDTVFTESPSNYADWLIDGHAIDMSQLLHLKEVDEVAGDWLLVDASVSVGAPDGREIRASVTSSLMPDCLMGEVAREVAQGRGTIWRDLPEPGTDFYTYHGEVPWSMNFGSDVRRFDGGPRRLVDRAFDYFRAGSWADGLPAEPTTRYWGWEPHHSGENQIGSVAFASPAIAVAEHLHTKRGETDMRDARGVLATIYRRAEGTGFGSFFFFIRRDILLAYTSKRKLRLLVAARGERLVRTNPLDRDVPRRLQKIFQSGRHEFADFFIFSTDLDLFARSMGEPEKSR